MIYALEAYERHGRPTCSECTDRLRKQRGCKKPGYDMECQQPFRFTSPLLHERDKAEGQSGKHTVLYECPIGHVLRETPYIYGAIRAHAYAENGALNPLDAPGWLQQAIGVVASEKERLRRMADEERRGAGDADYGQRALRARHG